MTDVVATLGRREARQTRAEERPERVDRSPARLTDDGFELGEAQLDGVEVGTIRRQEPQRRNEDLFDIGQEAGPVHRAIEDPGGGEPRHPQRGDEGAALPPALGCVIGDPLAAGAAPIAPEQIGGDPAFIEKDEVGRVEGRGGCRPLRAGGRDVGAIVFGCAYRFF